MLNTSLHNPNVKDKPHFERFVSINRGIDNGGDLPEELLKVRIPIFSSPEVHLKGAETRDASISKTAAGIFPKAQQAWDLACM